MVLLTGALGRLGLVVLTGLAFAALVLALLGLGMIASFVLFRVLKGEK